MKEPRESTVRREMHERFVAENTSFLCVEAQGINIADYKIYINGNIHGTATFDEKPVNGQYVRLVPKEYKVIVRESDVNKPDRKESNTMCFTLKDKQEMKLVVVLQNNNLVLSAASANKKG